MKKKNPKTSGMPLHSPVFFLLLAVIAAILLWKIWPMHGIYVDPEARAAAELAFTELEKNEGWLLSDITLLSATKDFVAVMHRPHYRGIDSRQCFRVALTPFRLQRCDEKR